ncbi:TPA: DUF1672 family protein [Staphylococcus aureus]|nr:DUF1672 family protein [Staphylococcus aureus]HCV0588776.1 DUF1672 family protein [Staphylococcus aureus]HCV2661947.1 DUF1672 family protein [Staphylococcus aureus]HCV7221142.1 DUF1672 family protein [Staphylococcus aureus]
MFKRTKLILIATLLLSGCSTTNNESNNETKSVPEEMEASKYVGQGFQPPAEKDAIEFAKKHRKEFEKVGEQFFKDNFGLKVKATNVVGKDDGIEVYVHCDDHGIVFNASLPLYKDAIHQKGSMRSNDNGDDMSMMVGTVLSGFEYRAQKEKYDNLYKFFKENEKKYQYTGFTKDNTIDEMIDFSEVLKKKKNIPHDLNVSLQISNKYINTTRPNYSKKDVIEVGVFNHE